MASVQDIDSRLRTCEDMLRFILTTSRVEINEQTGVIRPDGTPETRRYVGSMLDIYRLNQSVPGSIEPAGKSVVESVNG